jgi:hypothetical protein
MIICEICKRKYKPYNKKQRFCSKKCKKKYLAVYIRIWRTKLTNEDILKRRKKALNYYYKHQKEHNIRARRYYHNHLKQSRKKQNARVYAQKHKEEILKMYFNKCYLCNKRLSLKNTILHHKEYKSCFDVVFPFHKECHIKYHKEQNDNHKRFSIM